MSLILIVAALSGCRAQQPWPLWEAYTKRFLDDQGRIIDRSAGDRTTSEGQAYAMFFALVDNDRAHFEKLLQWTEENLADGDLTLHLPAWSWGRNGSGQWRTIDDNSASDADVWMAYDLLEAGRLWHEPRYDKLGRQLAERIARQDVVLIQGVGTTLAPGPRGFHPDEQTWVVNPSYLALSPLVLLANRFPQGPWSAVVDSMPALVGGETSHGFAMDWLSAGPAGVHPSGPPVEPTTGARQPRPAGSYDAIRVYLWLGLADPGTRGRGRLVSALGGMTDAMRAAAVPPLEVGPEGSIRQASGGVGFSSAVVPFLLASGLKSQAHSQQARVDSARDAGSSLYGPAGLYYDQNLALFSTGFLEHRYAFARDGSLRVKWK